MSRASPSTDSAWLTRAETAGLALRVLLWLPLLFWAAWLWGWEYGHFFLPLYREALDAVLPSFGVLNLDIVHTHEFIFKGELLAEEMLVRDGKVLPKGFSVNVQTPMYVAVTHPLILAAAALIWPRLTWRARALRLACSLPPLLVLELIDVPLVLASSLNDLISFSLNPEADAASKWVDWVHVMDGGGRFALCIAAALAAAGLQQWISARWRARRG